MDIYLCSVFVHCINTDTDYGYQHFLGKKLHVSKKCVVASVASQQPGSELRKYTPALCLASYFINTDVYV